jgi:hypothetical protein
MDGQNYYLDKKKPTSGVYLSSSLGGVFGTLGLFWPEMGVVNDWFDF